MNYSPKFPLLERLAPDAQTRAGVAWRLYWLWPELRGLYLAALLAWAFAAYAAPRYFELPHYPGLGIFAPIELVVFVPLFYLGFLGGAPSGGFAPGCGRALAMLPVPGRRMRDAVWFIDVLSAPLIYGAACILVALIFPMPAPHRLWFITAAVLTATIYCGARANMSMSMLAYFRARPHGLLERLGHNVGQLSTWLVFLCLLAMILGRDNPQATWASAAICAAASAVSFAHRPMMSGNRGDGGARRKKGSAVFSSGWFEIARIYATPMLLSGAMIAGFSIIFRYITPAGDHGDFVPYQMLVVMNASAGQFLAMRVRTARLLPLSTRSLTVATLAYGLASAIPMLVFIWALKPERMGDIWSVIALLCVALIMAAIAASSIWANFYRLLWAVAFLGVTLIGIGLISVVFTSRQELPTLQLAMLGLLFAVPVFAAVAWSIDRKFWWDSKVYRHQFQQHQNQMNLGNLSPGGEALLLGFAILVTAVGILCSIVWYAGAAA